MKKNRFKPFPKEATMGDLYQPAMKIKTVAEAKEYFERLVEYCMASGKSRKEAEKIQKRNLGYVSGYYDQKTAKRVFRLFECAHPIFGTHYPTAREAFQAGRKTGSR